MNWQFGILALGGLQLGEGPIRDVPVGGSAIWGKCQLRVVPIEGGTSWGKVPVKFSQNRFQKTFKTIFLTGLVKKSKILFRSKYSQHKK